MLFRLLKNFARPYRRKLPLLTLFQLVQTAAVLLLPTLNGLIVDNGVVKGDSGYILRVGALMAGISLVQIAAAVAGEVMGSRMSSAIGRDLRSAVFRKVLAFSAREVNQFGASTLITRTVNDPQQVQLAVMLVLNLAVSAVIMCLGGLALALGEDIQLSAIVLTLVGLAAVGILVALLRAGPSYELMQRCIDRINAVLRDQITGVRVIRAFVRDHTERERFEKSNNALFTVSLRVGRMMATVPVVLVVAMNTVTVAVVWFGGHRIADGAIPLGALSAMLGYLMLIVMSIIMLTVVFTTTPRAVVSARRIQEVLTTKPSVLPPARPVTPRFDGGCLELFGAEFGYPGAESPVLRQVYLQIRTGETVAIVGGTGSGKSTLLHLMLRLVDATAGRVMVNGVDIRSIDTKVLCDIIGYVPQKADLVSGTIASTLRYAAPEATDKDLWQALEIAQAAEFVKKMPDQLDTSISRSGTTVSGGQAQRLAIARTVLRSPRIYLFDDCFSALDYHTEAAVMNGLFRAAPRATKVIVTQRINTVRYAHRVVVLDQGRVVGIGTPAELMRENAIYRGIALSQPLQQEVPDAIATLR